MVAANGGVANLDYLRKLGANLRSSQTANLPTSENADMSSPKQLHQRHSFYGRVSKRGEALHMGSSAALDLRSSAAAHKALTLSKKVANPPKDMINALIEELRHAQEKSFQSLQHKFAQDNTTPQTSLHMTPQTSLHNKAEKRISLSSMPHPSHPRGHEADYHRQGSAESAAAEACTSVIA
jgi:hypothetical protein